MVKDLGGVARKSPLKVPLRFNLSASEQALNVVLASRLFRDPVASQHGRNLREVSDEIINQIAGR